MVLEQIEKNVLLALYKADYEGGDRPNPVNLGFEGYGNEIKQHATYHLEKLKDLNLVRFDGSPFTTGGRKHSEYKNNTVLILWEKIHITQTGVSLLEKE
ncbi:hypothetical protein [Bacillus sp. SM2101]|uniref:hypothetical protein n=1 Tax=Bacillus sp. SM2101 TaxID=2805366 RepID=UPI001BDEC807|nr:hypothetical protein [Bacillus sp. SM2101]